MPKRSPNFPATATHTPGTLSEPNVASKIACALVSVSVYYVWGVCVRALCVCMGVCVCACVCVCVRVLTAPPLVIRKAAQVAALKGPKTLFQLWPQAQEDVSDEFLARGEAFRAEHRTWDSICDEALDLLDLQKLYKSHSPEACTRAGLYATSSPQPKQPKLRAGMLSP